MGRVQGRSIPLQHHDDGALQVHDEQRLLQCAHQDEGGKGLLEGLVHPQHQGDPWNPWEMGKVSDCARWGCQLEGCYEGRWFSERFKGWDALDWLLWFSSAKDAWKWEEITFFSFKLNGFGRRFMFVRDGKGVIVKVWGGYNFSRVHDINIFQY